MEGKIIPMGAVSDTSERRLAWRIEWRMTPNEHHTPFRASNAVK